MADEDEERSKTSSGFTERFSTDFGAFSYPIQDFTSKPYSFRPFSKSLLARLDLGSRRFVFVERFEQIKFRSSSAFLAFAQTATVTPSLKHALAVPSPIAIH